jgi:hypothetical protein
MRAEVPGQIEQGRDAIHVADGPVDYKAGASGLHDVVGQVVADHAARSHASGYVHHKNVAALEQVDGILVVARPLVPLRFPLRCVHLRNIGPQRHQLQGKRPAYQFLIRMQNLEAVHELIGESTAGQADFFRGHVLELLQKRVGDLRPSVRETVVRVLDRLFDQLFAGHGEDLSPGRRQDKPTCAHRSD